MAEEEVAEHYVAEVKIVKVRKGIRRTVGQHAPFRETSVIARLVVPGIDLESLKGKVSQHIALVDDAGDIDEGKAHRG